MTGSAGIGGSETNIPPQNEITDQNTNQVEAAPEAQDAAASVEKASLQPEQKVEAEARVQEAEAVEQAFTDAMAAAENANLDGKGADLQAVRTEGEGGPELDNGSVEQAVDLRQDTRVSDQYSPGDGTRGEDIGYQGGDPEIDPRSEVEVGDPFGKGSGDEVDAGLPGPNQEAELGDLASAAAFGGGDSRVGWTGEQSMTDSMDSDGNQNIQFSEKYTNDDGSSTEVQTTHENGKTTQTVTHTDANGKTTTETSTDEAPDTEQEVYDPMGADEVEFDDTLSGALPGALPETEIDDLDDESLMQPAGEDEMDRERDPNLVFDRSSQVDPYAQYTGEEQGTPDLIPENDLDPGGDLIDGPEIVIGGEGIQAALESLASSVAVSDSARNDQAAAVVQEGALAGKGAADLQALTANAVRAQYGELSESDQQVMQAVVAGKAASAIDAEIASLEEKLNTLGEDGQLANIDLQSALQRQQQTLQLMSNVSKMVHDVAMGIIRKIG